MAIQGLEEIQQKKEQAKVEIKNYNKRAYLVFSLFLLACVVFVFVFGHTRNLFDTDYSIDYNAWGTYGDFIGGLFGTAIASYALILMIRTLQKQIDSNLQVEESNLKVFKEATLQRKQMTIQTDLAKRQLFDSQFNVFLKQYQDALGAYESPNGKSRGKKRVEEIVRNYRLRPFEYKTTYMKRCKSAASRFEELYVRNRHYMSVHLRTLYQVFKFISKADIDEETKLLYAKVVRGQLSEPEMFLIRYNCYSYYGRKMQKYCNQYNLLKHVSLMGLLEFKKWAIQLHNREMDNSIDAFYLQFRKELVKALLNEHAEQKRFEIECGKRWKYEVEVQKDNKQIDVSVIHTPRQLPGGVAQLPIEKAFNLLCFDNVWLLLHDLLAEMLFAKNFQKYNQSLTTPMRRKKKEISTTQTKAGFIIKSEYPIILSQRQLQNPVIETS